jgi:hypothetical protein
MEGYLHSHMRLHGLHRGIFAFTFERVKSKAIPLEAWIGPEGSRRLRLPDFKRIGT